MTLSRPEDDCNCLLCLKRKADKTGSHIIPSFLMKRINGEGERDHEVGFEIANGIVKTYFGRDIYEEQRRQITDDEKKMESRENYDVRDYIFCCDCEKYFSSLESSYAQSLSLTYKENENAVNNKVSPAEAMLFWCSLVWRASVTGHLGKRLHPDLEERLRTALIRNSIEGLGVKYALFRCKDYGKISDRGTIVCMDVKVNTVLMIVDDFMLAMVFDVGEDHHKVKLMDMELTLIPTALNDGNKPENISPFPVGIFDNVMASVIRVAVKAMGVPEKFSGLHETLFGSSLPDSVMTDILNLEQKHPCKLGDRYTIEH